MIEIKTLENVGQTDLLACFNEAFSDYLIPFKLTSEQLRSKLDVEDIQFGSSIGAFKNNKLVGFVIHGIKVTKEGKLAYNGGTGVIPSERGQGLTRSMYAYILPRLKADGINKVTLEVISNNYPAIKSYKKIGFTSIRNLNCYKGEIQVQKINPEVTVKQLDKGYQESKNINGNVKPSWQNSNQAIRNLKKTAHCICAYKQNKLIGHVVINTANNRVLQILVHNDHRRERVGSTLMNYIKKIYSPATSIINVESSNKPTNAFLEKCGLSNFLQQIEMDYIIR